MVDRGESGYRNRFLPDGRILYMGEGKRGDQEPVGGNLRLLLAHREGTPLRVFLRERPGVWRDLDELATHWQAQRRFLPTMPRARAQELMARWDHAVRQATAT